MLLWLATVAFGGSLYVNGVNVDGIRNQTFKGCEVTIDAAGNIHVTAPGYNITVVDDGKKRRAPTDLPAELPGATLATLPAEQAAAAPPPTSMLPAATWWLLAEDAGSSGHQVVVYVNGARVVTVSSGAGHTLRDLGPYLRPGNNTVRVESTSVASSSGSLSVVLASGESRSGTVVLGEAKVRYGTAGAGSMSRDYQVVVK
jgi:hypothetical protein